MSQSTRRIQLPFESVDKKPYIFASYGHDDKEVVFPLLKQLYEAGYNVWYDEGITIGEKYDKVIADHIKNSAVFLFFASDLSMSRPYILDVELDIANRNIANVPILPLFIEPNAEIPKEAADLIPVKRFYSLKKIISELRAIGVSSFGKRKALPIERDVPLDWFDGHSLDPAGGGNNIVEAESIPYACLAFDIGDIDKCAPYVKELFYAGYNVRSCEKCASFERERMLKDENCRAFVPFVTDKYIISEQLEKDYKAAKGAGKDLIALYMERSEELPDSIIEDFEAIQGLDIRELTNNDFLSKLEIELEKRKCYEKEEHGKVVRRRFEIPGFLYDLTEDGKGIKLTKYIGDTKNVEIKRNYNGFPVFEIGEEAFKNSSVSSVSIPDRVRGIGKDAFKGCGRLTSVHITDVAAWCSINFNGWFSNPLYFAKRLYLNGKLIENLIIPQSTKIISNSAFTGCTSLTSVTIPKSVTSIGASAFETCSRLTSVTIPDSITSIGSFAFWKCTDLTSVTIPDSVTEILNATFCDCSSLTSITIPDSVTSIGNEAFSRSALTSVNIPDSVTDIGAKAFSMCRLTSVTIPCSVKSIGEYAFECRLDSIDSIYITDLAAWCDIDFKRSKEYPYYSNPLQYANNLYLNGKLIKELIIPDSVTIIKTSAFQGCKCISSVTIPNGVTSIGNSAFKSCANLTSVTIPDSVTSIEDEAFENCSSLTSINIPDSVDIIGDSVFHGCDKLKNSHLKKYKAWRKHLKTVKTENRRRNRIYYKNQRKEYLETAACCCGCGVCGICMCT